MWWLCEEAPILTENRSGRPLRTTATLKSKPWVLVDTSLTRRPCRTFAFAYGGLSEEWYHGLCAEKLQSDEAQSKGLCTWAGPERLPTPQRTAAVSSSMVSTTRSKTFCIVRYSIHNDSAEGYAMLTLLAEAKIHVPLLSSPSQRSPSPLTSSFSPIGPDE